MRQAAWGFEEHVICHGHFIIDARRDVTCAVARHALRRALRCWHTEYSWLLGNDARHWEDADALARPSLPSTRRQLLYAAGIFIIIAWAAVSHADSRGHVAIGKLPVGNRAEPLEPLPLRTPAGESIGSAPAEGNLLFINYAVDEHRLSKELSEIVSRHRLRVCQNYRMRPAPPLTAGICRHDRDTLPPLRHRHICQNI